MKLKTYLLALGITSSILPVTVLGAELLDKDGGGSGGGTGPRAKKRSLKSILPVIIEIEPGTINLFFTTDLGEVTIELQEIDGATILSKEINTSIQNEDSFTVCTGAYILTVTTADGINLVEKNIVIP